MSLILLDLRGLLSEWSVTIDDDESRPRFSENAPRNEADPQKEASIDEELDLSSVQKGKVTEALVASTLILASTGRLSPFAPISDDCGIDLVIFDKKTHRTLPLQIKSRIANPARHTVQFNIRKASFGDLGNRYLLGVVFDPVNIALTASWLIPMSRVRDVSIEKAETYALTPSALAESRDRYQEFRLNTARDLADAVIRAISNEDNLPPKMS